MNPYLAPPAVNWNIDILVLSGLVVLVLVVVACTVLLIRRESSTVIFGSQALAGGLALGLAGGLAGGIAFVFARSRAGSAYLLPPFDFRAGLITGLSMSALVLLALGTLTYLGLRRSSLISVLIGTAAGLVLFRLIFGPTAGFGGELGEGFGSEVGIMFGAAGGLLGGIAGHGFDLATRNMHTFPSHVVIDETTPMRPDWRWLVMGLVLGGLGATLVGALGAYFGIFQLLVPYVAQVPDPGPDLSAAAALNNVLFGLGTFAAGGALIGSFLALQRMSFEGRSAQRYALWAGVGLVAGLIGGLGAGLDVSAVGGPRPLNFVPVPHPDPSGGVRGLLVGLMAGALLGAALLVLARSRRIPSRWTLAVRESAVFITGMLALTFPLWYTPFWGVAIH